MSRALVISLVVVVVGGVLALATGSPVDGQYDGTLNLLTVARIGGESKAVAADGDRVLLAEGQYVLTVDLSGPDAPRLVGQAGPFGGEISDIAIEGTTAFVASPNGASVVDVTDLAAPRVLAVLLPGPALAVDVEDTRLYAVEQLGDRPWSAEGGRLHVFDVANPSAPIELGAADGVTGRWGIEVDDGIAWLPEWSQGLVAIDASDPDDIREVSRLGEESGMRSPTCAGVDREKDRLYVAAQETSRVNTKGLVVVFDTSDPAAPLSLGSKARLDYTAADCAWSDDLFYVAQLDDGVEVHRATGDGPTSRVLQLTTHMEAFAVDASHGLTLVVEGLRSVPDIGGPGQIPGLTVFDVSTRVGHVPTANYAAGVALDGGVAYVAAAASGLRSYDVSDPFEPRLLGAVAYQSGVANRIAIDGDVALAADGSAGVRTYDIADPVQVRQLGEYKPAGNVSRLSAQGGTGLALAPPGEHVSVFDYSDPSVPREVTRMDGWFADVSHDGAVGMLAGDRPSLAYVDLTDPANPVTLGEVHPDGRDSLAVAEADNGLALLLSRVPGYYFIPTPRPTPPGPPTAGPSPTRTPAATAPPDGSGLVLVDGSDPRAPRVLSTIVSSAAQDTVAYHRGRAYVGPHAGAHAYDVSVPSQPGHLRLLIDGELGALRMEDAVGHGDMLYVASGSEGLRIVRPLGEDDPTPTATTTARGPGTLPPPYYTMTADAAATMTADAAATLTAGTPDIPINWQLYVPVAEAGGG